MQAIVSATGDAARCMQVDDELSPLTRRECAEFVVLGDNPIGGVDRWESGARK